MSIDDILSRERSHWMTGTGPSADIVLSSRIRLARNLADVPFPPRLSAADAGKVIQRVKQTMPDLERRLGRRFHLIEMAKLPALDRQVLVEKHLVSPMLAKANNGAVVLSEDEAISIMINEEDHLRIQVLKPGLQLDAGWQLANTTDDVLAGKLKFAFNQRQGFLTTCPSNLGTGMRVSVMVHLPGLVLANQASQVLGSLAKIGIVVRGMYGEGSEARGNLFQISNQVTLGQAEDAIVENLSAIARQVVERERSVRERLYQEMKTQLEDRACRAYGILTNARMITSDEALRLLSDLRLGIDLQIVSHVSPLVFSDLMVSTRPGFLQRVNGEPLGPEERDQRRATLIRERLQQAP